MPGTLRAFPNADLLQDRCKFNSIIFVFRRFPPLGSPTSAEALFSASGACDWLCLTDVNRRRVQLNFAQRHVHEPPHLRVYSHIRGRLLFLSPRSFFPGMLSLSLFCSIALPWSACLLFISIFCTVLFILFIYF